MMNMTIKRTAKIERAMLALLRKNINNLILGLEADDHDEFADTVVLEKDINDMLELKEITLKTVEGIFDAQEVKTTPNQVIH